MTMRISPGGLQFTRHPLQQPLKRVNMYTYTHARASRVSQFSLRSVAPSEKSAAGRSLVVQARACVRA